MESELTSYYNQLKSDVDAPQPVTNPEPFKFDKDSRSFLADADSECKKLKEKCAKHIILDVYFHISPLDSKFKANNPGQMQSDVDTMLKSKSMTPMQYLTAGYKATKAPLLEFIIRSIDNIGKSYMETAENDLKKAKANKVDIKPKKADINIDPAKSQLVEIKDDMEYGAFKDKLKEKTVDKIVDDISKVLKDKKETDKMTFKTKSDDSTTLESVCIDYAIERMNKRINKHLTTESLDTDKFESILGYTIRESTLNQLDNVFEFPESDLKSFNSRLRLNRGLILNESAIDELCKRVE